MRLQNLDLAHRPLLGSTQAPGVNVRPSSRVFWHPGKFWVGLAVKIQVPSGLVCHHEMRSLSMYYFHGVGRLASLYFFNRDLSGAYQGQC